MAYIEEYNQQIITKALDYMGSGTGAIVSFETSRRWFKIKNPAIYKYMLELTLDEEAKITSNLRKRHSSLHKGRVHYA